MGEIVTVAVGGTRYTSWKKVSLRACFKEAARSFVLTVAAEGGGTQVASVFQLGTPVSIFAGGDLVVTGYVNARRPHFSKEEAQIVIAGRSKGQDAIDCSALHKTGSFKQQTPVQIAQALDQFGIGFSSDRQLDPVDYQITPGETVHDAVEGLARDQGKTLAGQPDGSVNITDASSAQKHAGGLIEGVNIEVGDADQNDGSRHSEVRARGQRARGHGKDNLQMEAVVNDGAVARYRPHLIVHDGDVDQSHLQRHAQHHRDRAAGASLRATIVTPSWRDPGGALWTPGWLTWTQSAFLALTQDMLIETATLDLEDGGGTKATLDLVDPQAYGGQAGKGSQSGSGWGF